jgi:YD repeat-containing protein
MTDGLGTVTYAYDQQSRLTDETRDFTDTLSSEPSGHYNLHYTYTLPGALASIRDPFNATVTYARDEAGQTTAITGSGTANLSGDYASDLAYRAWGSVKSMNYGDGNSMSASFNDRLQTTEYEVPGILHNSYDYNNDGRLSYSHDLTTTDSKFDRSFQYDHVGRMTQLRTGDQARNPSSTTLSRPYREDLTYDAFGNLTNRAGWFWWKLIKNSATTFTYGNNRNGAWDYDVDGRLLDSSDVQYEYDAAGRSIHTESDRSSIGLSYDGDGRRVKSVNSMTDTATPPNTTSVTTYYLPSSLLNQTIAELDGTGAKKQGYILNGSGILAQEKTSSGSDAVLWHLSDESGYQVRFTNMDGDVEPDYSAELDPFGTDARTAAPGPVQMPTTPGEEQNGSLNSIGFGDPIASGMGECRLNGMEVSCQQALGAMSNGSGQVNFAQGAAGSGILNLPGMGDIILILDGTIPLWNFTGNPEFPENNDGSQTVVSLGGSERNHPTGPTNPGTGTEIATQQPEKTPCNGTLAADIDRFEFVDRVAQEVGGVGEAGEREARAIGNAIRNYVQMHPKYGSIFNTLIQDPAYIIDPKNRPDWKPADFFAFGIGLVNKALGTNNGDVDCEKLRSMVRGIVNPGVGLPINFQHWFGIFGREKTFRPGTNQLVAGSSVIVP